jgi:hypothetical protein
LKLIPASRANDPLGVDYSVELPDCRWLAVDIKV